MATRVHLLAKELGVKSKAIIDKCVAEGVTSINGHMSVVSVGLEATIREWFSEGEHTTAVEVTEHVDLEQVREKPKRRTKKHDDEEGHAGEPTDATADDVAHEEHEPPIVEETTEPTAEPTPNVEHVEPEQQAHAEPTPHVAHEEHAKPAHDTPHAEPTKHPHAEHHAKPAKHAHVEPEPVAEAVVEPTPIEPVAEAEQAKAADAVRPAGPQHIPAPAVLQGPRVVRVERPEPVQQRPPMRPGVSRPRPGGPGPAAPATPETDARGRAPKRGGRGPAGETEAEKKNRLNPRRAKTADGTEQLKEWRDRDLIERSQRLAAATDHPQVVRRVQNRKSAPHITPTMAAKKAEGPVELTEPIILKDFCSSTAIPFNRLFPKLMELGIGATINQAITGEQAELLAMTFDIPVKIVRPLSAAESLAERYSTYTPDATHMKLRPPIVTLLGHVDHGKTSLLDRIRTSRVTAGEAGGITQHIGAYRYERDGKAVVFLDTPGHEAFTALRARGAQMTDVVVLVVAGDDGVMPQTVEAISHAKAAGVPIVVALNKIDLPGVDENKIFGQLAEHQLVASDWGGETDIIRTSATTGRGVEELIEHLYTLSELLQLKADPDGPVGGVIIEARQDASRGPVASMMVQQGTLRVGDAIVASGASGRVRAIFDDLGRAVESAGPATPVEVLGFDGVPTAGDRFYCVATVQEANAIANERRMDDRRMSWTTRPAVTLENLFDRVGDGDLKQLNLIVRADTQGSVDVLKNKLAELSNDEVRIRLLHAGPGGVTEGDVVLAEASQAIIIGFGVVADEIARTKAQTLNVQIKTYTVIYHLLEDIQRAMDGMLEPTYERVNKGRAVIRNVFKITRVGSVAGCHVLDGVIERNAKIRIIRNNVIIREDAVLDSLKRFKDDVKEVKQGFECGMKLVGFDDLKEGDVLEAYQVQEQARTTAGSGRKE